MVRNELDNGYLNYFFVLKISMRKVPLDTRSSLNTSCKIRTVACHLKFRSLLMALKPSDAIQPGPANHQFHCMSFSPFILSTK